MRHILHKGRVIWKSFEDNSIDAYVGYDGELVIDARLETRRLRLHDGVTPGGHLISDTTLYGIRKPSIIAPIDNARFVSIRPLITAAPFLALTGTGDLDQHATSVWEIATDSNFTNIEFTHTDTIGEYREHVDIGALGHKLSTDTIYYARVTFTSNYGLTDTSPVISFTTTPIALGEIHIPTGGLVVGQNKGDWIILADATKRVRKPWGLLAVDTSISNGIVPDPETGKFNTDILMLPENLNNVDGGGNVGCPAAIYARSHGFDLPNREEVLMLVNYALSNNTPDVELDNLVSTNAVVWTSSEHDLNYAASVTFGTSPTSNPSLKTSEHWTLPVKRIPV